MGPGGDPDPEEDGEDRGVHWLWVSDPTGEKETRRGPVLQVMDDSTKRLLLIECTGVTSPEGAHVLGYPSLDEFRTPEGEVTGMVVTREVAHRYGYLHGTVHLWIYRPSQDATGVDVLLQRRSENKESYPSCLDISSAGHISAGQAPEDAVLRELNEELGLTPALSELTFLGTFMGYSSGHFHGKVFRNHELSYVYTYEKDLDPLMLSPDPEEVSEVCWIPGSVVSKAAQTRDPGYCLYEKEWEMVLTGITSRKNCKDGK